MFSDKNEANRGIQLRDVDGPSPRQQDEEVEAERDTRELTIAKDVEVESNETGEDIVEETEAEETNKEIGVETEQEVSVDEAEEEVGVETELESPAMQEEDEEEEEEEESTRDIQGNWFDLLFLDEDCKYTCTELVIIKLTKFAVAFRFL